MVRESAPLPSIRKAAECSKNLFYELETFNIHFATAETEEIFNMIRKDSTVNLDLGMSTTHTSTHEKPTVIYEFGASICSLLVGVDHDGNMVSLHKPLGYLDDDAVEERLSSAGFLSAVESILNKKRIFFLTATSVDEKERKKLLDQLRKILGQDIQFFFLKDAPEVGNKQRLRKIWNTIREFLKGHLQVEHIHEILLIPSYISTTGKNEILVPHTRNKKTTPYQTTQRLIEKLKEKLQMKVGS